MTLKQRLLTKNRTTESKQSHKQKTSHIHIQPSLMNYTHRTVLVGRPAVLLAVDFIYSLCHVPPPLPATRGPLPCGPCLVKWWSGWDSEGLAGQRITASGRHRCGGWCSARPAGSQVPAGPTRCDSPAGKNKNHSSQTATFLRCAQWVQFHYLQPGVAKWLVHAEALPHFHLQQVVDQVGGCKGCSGAGQHISNIGCEMVPLSVYWSLLFSFDKIKACLLLCLCLTLIGK